MFMAAGLIAESLGHDRIAGFAGIGRVLPITTFTFGIAGLSLMGVPPTGGFVAKWLLLQATVMEGQWWWAAVMLVGGLLAGGYIFMVLGKMLCSADVPVKVCASVTRSREVVALTLALCAVLLGLVPLRPSALLQIGRPAIPAVNSR
jgi:formate hydrogenlyase subunit 3/multisubunit Na+/H+ antiporter MnhD subunit